nr:DNA polymerase phi subunit [Cryptococcus depauperatus CBS 7855]
MASNVLPLFWTLASSNKETRLNASASLISSLENFQQSYKDNVGSSKGKQANGADEENESEEISEDEESGVEVDVSDDEDQKDAIALKLDKQLSSNNSEDVVYSVKRLVRGLGSSRESSRLGFAVALTELISRIPTVTVPQVFSLIMRSSQFSKNMQGTEERDMMFARLFGMVSLVQSKALFLSTASKETFQNVVAQFFKLGSYKAWMRESAWWALIEAVQGLLQSEVSWKKEAVKEVTELAFEEKGWTQEKVALILILENSNDDLDWKSCFAPTFKHVPLLNGHNLITLGRILKEATSEEEGVTASATGMWKPQLHFVWNIIMERYFSETGVSSSKSEAPFQDFFRVVVDESLFSNTASPQRRYWGLQVFERALPLLSPSHMPLIFTPNFMRCWMNNLSSSDRYLHKAAFQIARLVQDIAKSNPKVGFTLLSQLVGKHGKLDFDKVTKTKTVEGIMGNLNEEGVKDFVDFLKGTIIGTSQGDSDTTKLDERRLWALNQLLALCKNGSVPKNDACISSMLDFLLVHGFFFIKHANKKCGISAIHNIPRPSLGEVVAQGCRSKFFGCVVELSTAAVPRRVADEEPRQQGCDASGKTWLRRAVTTISSLEQDKKHLEVITDADDEIKSLRSSALEILSSLTKLKREKKSLAKAFDILISFFILQTYDETDDSLDNLEDITTAAQQYLGVGDADVDVEAINLLLDVLISLLDKGSSDLRSLANLVFGMISGDLNRSSMEHLAAQLERSAAEAAAEEFEQEHNEDDGIDSEDDGQESGDESQEADEEEEDEEEDDDDDNEMCDVDPVFRARVAEALQVSEMGIDESEDGDDLEEEDLWDDEQMIQVDEQLTKIFKERAAGTNKKDSKYILTESIHFKNRILDFYDTYVKRQTTNPLVLDGVLALLKFIRIAGVSEAEVANKAAGILRGKFSKPKDIPSTADINIASQILQEIHTMIKKAHSTDFSNLSNLCSLYVSRTIEASSKSSKSPVVEVYRSTLKDFMTRKASLVHPPIILEFVKRFPIRAFELYPDLISYVSPGAAVNAFRQLQGYAALQNLAQRLAEISQSVALADITSFVHKASDSVFTTLITASDASSESKEAWNAQKLKDVVKFALQLARNSKILNISWDIEKVERVGKKLRSGERTKDMKGVHSMWMQLEGILRDRNVKVR